MSTFAIGSAFGLGAVVSAAGFLRGRFYAAFALTILGIHTLISIALYPHLAWAAPLYVYLQGAVYLHFFMLTRPQMRPLAYRALVSVPGSWFAAGTMLALPWAVAAPILGALDVALPVPWLPYVVAAIGIFQSFTLRKEQVDVALDDQDFPELQRWQSPSPAEGQRPLSVVQITDPHLGPFMSEARLRRICQRAVDMEPDLILLTGDFLTMESQGTPGAFARSLEPLRAMQGRTFACRGNHDHEAPAMVSRALASAGVRLLNDEAVRIGTPIGAVEILGVDHRWRGRAEHIAAVFTANPRSRDIAMRIVLLHDPAAFPLLPDGQADVVFSGHTHGGQVGFVSLGLPQTAVSLLSKIPDHGLWAIGRNRLYVHRGTGHYGFPLRLGVPAEESLVRLYPASAAG